MKLSSETLTILKNMASINSNLVVEVGNHLKTISTSKTMFANAEVAETFPLGFGLYDLNEFLSVLSLVDDPDLEFNENYVIVTGSKKSEGVKYFYSSPEILTYPQKNVVMPNPDLTITIKNDELSRLIKAASVLGHTELCFKGSNGKVTATVSDTKNQTANTYSFTLTEDCGIINEFSFNVSISNLKLIPGEYTVSFSKAGISRWVSDKIEYFIALEKTSTFN